MQTLCLLNFPYLIKECQEYNISPILEWDILMTEKEFTSATSVLDALELSGFKGVMVADAGAIHYLFSEYKDISIHLLLDNGNHNTYSKWYFCSG